MIRRHPMNGEPNDTEKNKREKSYKTKYDIINPSQLQRDNKENVEDITTRCLFTEESDSGIIES